MKIMRRKAGFTLLEIMIAASIISILAAVAIPNFIKYRNRSREQVCKGNIQMIYYAVEQYALDYNLNNGASVSVANMVSGGFLNSTPTCPSNGAGYGATQTVGTPPTCPAGIAGHSWTP